MTKKIKKDKQLTTYERVMASLTPKEKKEYEQEYKEFLISEMLLAAMEQDDISVRKLAKLAGVSPTVVQGVRSGDRENITVQSFVKILKALDCSLVVEKGGQRFPLDLPKNK